jgi:hypothetical protein
MSYRKLGIWQLARELTVDVHEMTLQNVRQEPADYSVYS